MLRERYLNKQRDLSNKRIYPPFPQNVKIDICNVCNYSCVFCPQATQYNKIGNIDKTLCLKIIKDAFEAGGRNLCLSMTGEPLLNKELELYVSYAKELGYQYVFLNTNGYFLTEDRTIGLLKAGVDSIKVSVNSAKRSYELIHGVDAFERVINNIKKFDYYRKMKGVECKLYISYVAVKQTLAEVNQLKEILEPYVDDIIVMNANSRGGSVHGLEDKMYVGEDEFSFTYPCSQLFNNIYVTSEGYVVICCQDFENLTVVADLNNENICDAWNNNKFTEFRRRYLNKDLKGTLCQNCIYNTQEEVEPLTKESAGYDISSNKQLNLNYRIRKLIEEI